MMLKSALLTPYANLMHGFVGKQTAGFYGYDGDLGLHQLSGFLSNTAYSYKQCVHAWQVQGNQVQTVSAKDCGERIPQTDGLFTQSAQTVLIIKMADCVPILIYDSARGNIAAVHAGWHGAIEGVLDTAISRFLQHGSRASDLLLVLGPALGGCCYDIPNERAQLFSAHYSEVITKKVDRFYLDLPLFLAKQAKARGILPEHIDLMRICTQEAPLQWHSYRYRRKLAYPVIMNNIAFIVLNA